MRRKVLVVFAALCILVLALSTPRLSDVGAWARPAEADQQQITANDFGHVLTAPFRAIGNWFRGGKKKKTVSKITDKDIQNFESTDVSRVTDANTPPASSSPSDATVAERLQRGRELLNAGQLNEAIKELTAATAMDANSGEAHTLLGVAYDRKGMSDRAREAFQTALHDPNDQAMHLNNLGFLLYRQGRYDEAIKYLKRAAKANPAETKILNNLALVQLAAEKYDDAYKTSVHLLGEAETRVKIARGLDWNGHTKDAIKQLEKARALQPDSAEVLSQLAKLYESTGEAEKAHHAREQLTSLQAAATTPEKK
jgi:Flp pilus assembly protein TadD